MTLAALIDFQTPLAQIAGLIKNAKRSGNYDEDPSSYDKSLAKLYDGLFNQCIQANQEQNKRVQQSHDVCKKIVDEMEVLIKKKGKALSESDLKVLATSVRNVAHYNSDLEKKAKELYDRLAHYRENIASKYAELMSDPDVGKSFQNKYNEARRKSIDDNKAMTAVKERLDQYVTRSADMLKLAQTVAKVNATSGPRDAAADNNAIQTFSNEIDTLKFDDEAQKAKNTFTKLVVEAKSPKLGLKDCESLFNSAATYAKNARGLIKTLTIKIEAFSKLASKMEGEAKKAAAVALKTANTKLKDWESQEKSLAKLDKSAEEAMKTIRKRK
jgi:hypothetical protein